MSSLLEMMPGDAVANRLLQLAQDFVGLISDKDGAAQRLSALAQATAAAQAAIKEAKKTMKQADERTASFKTELAQHEDLLLRQKQAQEHEVNEFQRMRGALLDEATKLRDQAQRDADEASNKLRALNHKLEMVQQAASSAA
jgi:hypothetical protein